MTDTKTPTLKEAFEDLQSRFLLNLPNVEVGSWERIFVQIEQGFWFYEDFYADKYRHLPHYSLKSFAQEMFKRCAMLQGSMSEFDSIYNTFKSYLSTVPVMGCILLNVKMDKLVLLRNWKGTSWTFPRGKVNQGESAMDCGVRETLEESGFDAASLVNAQHSLQITSNGQRCKMYIVRGVPEDYAFSTQTRKEISKIQWFALDALPKSSWGVLPFMGPLHNWINRQSQSKRKGNRRDSPSKNVGRALSGSGAGKSRDTSPLQAPAAQRQKGASFQSPARGGAFASGARQHRDENRSKSVPIPRPPPAHIPTSGISTAHSSPAQVKKTVRSSPPRRRHEMSEAVDRDHVNEETFGVASSSWSVDDMFAKNEQLTGRKFEYDGDPQSFGTVNGKVLNASAYKRMSWTASGTPASPSQGPALVRLSDRTTNPGASTTKTKTMTPSTTAAALNDPAIMSAHVSSGQSGQDRTLPLQPITTFKPLSNGIAVPSGIRREDGSGNMYKPPLPPSAASAQNKTARSSSTSKASGPGSTMTTPPLAPVPLRDRSHSPAPIRSQPSPGVAAAAATAAVVAAPRVDAAAATLTSAAGAALVSPAPDCKAFGHFQFDMNALMECVN